VFFTQLSALATARGVGWLPNPPLPLDRADQPGGLTLWCKPRGDVLIRQPGGHPEERRMRLVLGVRSLTADALGDADELHFAARVLLRGQAWRQAVRAQLPSGGSLGPCREVEIEGELKSVSAEGSGLISAFEIEYEQPYPAA
jgi:hypothetical protein